MPLIIKKVGKDIESSVYKALEKLSYSPSRKNVFLKPNIVAAHKPGAPYITNPRVVAGIIDYLRDKGAEEIVIGEGSAGKESGEAFRVSGYSKLCLRKKVQFIDLHNAERVEVKLKDARISLPRIVFESEYINVSKLKTHVQTTVSLGLKNQKGLLSAEDRKFFHKNLHERIADLALAVRPALSVIDATSGIEGNGPGRLGKEVKGINLVICGTDFLQTDFIGATLMGIDPCQVKHLKKAKDLGLSPLTVSLMGEDLEGLKMNFVLPKENHRIFNAYFWWSEEACSECSSALGELKGEIFRSPALLLKILNYGLLRRIDFIIGDIRKPPEGGRKILCIGNCSRAFAAKNSLPVVQGCPPSLKDILKHI